MEQRNGLNGQLGIQHETGNKEHCRTNLLHYRRPMRRIFSVREPNPSDLGVGAGILRSGKSVDCELTRAGIAYVYIAKLGAKSEEQLCG